MTDDTTLKTTFNEDAGAYHTFRPRYPEALFKKLIRDTHLTPTSKLLEIGPGTGQATETLAKQGFHITAIELGAAMAQKAHEVLVDSPNVTIRTGAFEDVPLPDSHFDLVFAATAFHWIHPDYKFKKSFQVLKPEGYLAIIHTEHVSDEKGDKFVFASLPIYQRHSSSPNDNFRLPKVSDLAPPTIDTTLFTLQSFTVFPYSHLYSGREYAGLLSTYSPTIAMPPKERKEFLASIRRLIEVEFNDNVARNFAMTLTIAKKNSP